MINQKITYTRFLIPLISLLCPLLSLLTPSSLLSALSSLCCYKPLRGKSLSCLCHPLNLLPLLLISSSSSMRIPLYIFLKFYLCLYIWSEKNILKVEFLINKTPSNTNLLPKTTKYHQRFWNICWKIFRSVYTLFVLANDLFVLFWVLKKFVVHAMYIFSFVDICSVQVTLDWDLIF